LLEVVIDTFILKNLFGVLAFFASALCFCKVGIGDYDRYEYSLSMYRSHVALQYEKNTLQALCILLAILGGLILLFTNVSFQLA
jgi:hypothetical protein